MFIEEEALACVYRRSFHRILNALDRPIERDGQMDAAENQYTWSEVGSDFRSNGFS